MSAALIAAGIQSAASLFGGISANRTAKRNAARIDENARRAELNGAFEAERIAREERAAAGEALAIQALSGVQLGSGSALDTLRQSAFNREFDIAAARYQARTQADNLRLQAQDVRRGGRAALIGGIINAGVSGVQAVRGANAASRLRSAQTAGRGTMLPPGSGAAMPIPRSTMSGG